MIHEIYTQMLEKAKTPTPGYIEFIFNINKEQTSIFWSDDNNDIIKKEHGMLFDEWEMSGKSKYSKTLYGKKFSIQFTY